MSAPRDARNSPRAVLAAARGPMATVAAAATVCALCLWARSAATGPAPPRVPPRPHASTAARAPGEARSGMVWIPGGEFAMGAEDPRSKRAGGMDAMQDARPLQRVFVDGFWMDATEVTNGEFQRFVEATGYTTLAERGPRQEDVPGVPPENLAPGALVFRPASAAVPLNDPSQWWEYVRGASWRHPEGGSSDNRGRKNYPVVQIAYEDAEAYARWARKRLPTEAEWERAARGRLSGRMYTWGDDLKPGGKWVANVYQGRFPVRDTAEDGFAGIAPVAQFPPNGYGLYDMAGNVWEWCSDWYRPDYYQTLAAAGGVARNPRGPSNSLDPAEPGVPKRVQRGGSFLCSEQYCARYMVGSRGKGEVSTGSNHLGFRCVSSGP